MLCAFVAITNVETCVFKSYTG